MKHIYIITFETTKDISDLAQKIAGRVYAIEGIDLSKDVKVEPIDMIDPIQDGNDAS